jgi:hypothetical protein
MKSFIIISIESDDGECVGCGVLDGHLATHVPRLAAPYVVKDEYG